MRNKHRIQPIMEMLTKYWEMYPDMRFFQLIHNISPEKDPYHCEDNVIETILSELILEAQIQKNRPKDRFFITKETLMPQLREFKEFICPRKPTIDDQFYFILRQTVGGEHMPDYEAVMDVVAQQTKKGEETYGQTLDAYKGTVKQSLAHDLEEMIDSIKHKLRLFSVTQEEKHYYRAFEMIKWIAEDYEHFDSEGFTTMDDKKQV